jgi:hypothetical protein
MEEILPQSLPNSTYAAVAAMIYALFAVIIPELAYLTIILCSLLAALSAVLRCGLRMPA